MHENIDPEMNTIENFRLLEDSHSEYAMIWNTLFKASNNALECNNVITEFLTMCDEAKFLQDPYRQLNDMDYDEKPDGTMETGYENTPYSDDTDDEAYIMLLSLREMLHTALADIDKVILPQKQYTRYTKIQRLSQYELVYNKIGLVLGSLTTDVRTRLG